MSCRLSSVSAILFLAVLHSALAVRVDLGNTSVALNGLARHEVTAALSNVGSSGGCNDAVKGTWRGEKFVDEVTKEQGIYGMDYTFVFKAPDDLCKGKAHFQIILQTYHGQESHDFPASYEIDRENVKLEIEDPRFGPVSFKLQGNRDEFEMNGITMKKEE
mmetsp:Transcript_45761/g.85637  ORF Transcript_45761/g.85637 Transcript_45761/m.85637 type:complete len:161 (+) Transcript_45761:90-572(+)